MEAEEKLWGVTQTLHESDQLLVARISIVAGGYCSEHYHAHRHNQFIVHRGTLRIRYLRDNRWQQRDLQAGQHFLVPACEIHQFEALTPVMADEVYWPILGMKVKRNDIIRRSGGGVRR
jgi:mannose-6-phosphate isomerase-like protein (cupin superfamily)